MWPSLTRLALACARTSAFERFICPISSVYLSLCEVIYLTLCHGIGVCVCVCLSLSVSSQLEMPLIPYSGSISAEKKGESYISGGKNQTWSSPVVNRWKRLELGLETILFRTVNASVERLDLYFVLEFILLYFSLLVLHLHCMWKMCFVSRVFRCVVVPGLFLRKCFSVFILFCFLNYIKA